MFKIAQTGDFNAGGAKFGWGELSTIEQTAIRRLRHPCLSSAKERSGERVRLSGGDLHGISPVQGGRDWGR
jgi:hypothetical protein